MATPTPPPTDPAAARPDLQDPAVVIDLFQRAANASRTSRYRQGAVTHLPDRGRLLVTGDLHDHGLNFQRILKLAGLEKGADRHLILHEVIHGEQRINGRDLSVRMLARVAALKLAYPDNVHILQANHELAQLGGEGILKDGVSVVEAFDEGVDFLYDEQADAVREAMGTFIRSHLLAVKCANGIFISHSLPSPRVLETFDLTVLERVPTEADLTYKGSAYEMVWGRNHTQPLADTLAEAWGAKLFVMGHQPAEMGYETEGQSMLILASDHDHGCVLPIDLASDYDMEALIGQITPLAAVVL